MENNQVDIIQFSNQSKSDRKMLKRFVNFHWDHYADEPRYIPLLKYEYLGHRLMGVIGWFDPKHSFFNYGRMAFFLAKKDVNIVGRVCAFINERSNQHHHDKVGFFGFFESINDQSVANSLLDAASQYLHSEGMTIIRGPQNLPINEATPGTLIDGFDALPVIYYHFNYPYYAQLLEGYDMEVIKRVVGIDVPVQTPIEERLLKVTQTTMEKYNIVVESFSQKRYTELRKIMFEIYNEAWNDNWGFVPFAEDEFNRNIDDMKMVWDPNMFLFAFVEGEPAGFFGSMPNILEVMKPIPLFPRFELLRAAKMFLTKGKVKSFRQGYFGIRPKFRSMGLDAILISEAKKYTQKKGYQKCDIGWVLEDNEKVLHISNYMGGKLSRTYAIYQKNL